MDNITSIILKNVVHNETYCRAVLPFLKLEYFEGGAKIFHTLFLQYVTKYNSIPSKAAIEYEFAQSSFNTEKNASVLPELINTVYSRTEDDNVTDYQWLLEKTEEWCRDRAVYLGVLKAINIIDGTDKENAPGAIPDILSKALAVSFDRKIGHDYIDNASDRFDFYHRVIDKIPFDLEMMNKITKGGVEKKTLNCVIAGTGVGKSIWLCHTAAAALAEGENVLYITLEMSEEKIAERIDANLFDIPIDTIEKLTKREFDTKIDGIRTKSNGKLIIKEYPTAGAHVGHFRALIKDLEMKKKFKPDMIIIDYLNICASSRMRLGGSVNTYALVKSIAEEIRGLAIEMCVPIWTATQSNRDGIGASDIELSNTSESIGLAATLDFFIALIRTEELDALDQVMIKQLKNRYQDTSKFTRFILGLDKSKMRFYDAEDSAQDDIIMPELTLGGKKDKGAFDDFNV